MTQPHIFLIRAVNRVMPWFPEKVSHVERQGFIEQAKKYIWRKYVLGWDGKGERGIDCSHLVCASMIDAWGARDYFHRTAHDLMRLSQQISHEELSPGDLVFWNDSTTGRRHHVAIILCKNETTLDIIDASGESTGLWLTTERTADIREDMDFARPPFFI